MTVAVDEDLPPLAPLETLTRKLGITPDDLPAGEAARGEHLLREASELIREIAGTDYVDDDGVLTAVPRRVSMICTAAAFRAFNNPEGLSQRSIGDSSKSYDRAQREGGEDVYLTTAEKEAVRRTSGNNSMMSVTLVTPYNVEATTDDETLLVWE
jgi:hypothetical protein